MAGFDWKSLKQNALVVDVGGGIGSQSMVLAKNHSHLRFIVQDREQVLKDAVSVRDVPSSFARRLMLCLVLGWATAWRCAVGTGHTST
jgi:hypothetical protein